MQKPEDFGGGRADNTCCVHCCDDSGKLKSREDVKSGMMDLAIRMMGVSREEAEKTVQATMARMPAWKS
jgi:hypothetical protein